MLNLDTLIHFSSTYCIGICAFLIPFNLLATLSTIMLRLLDRPAIQIWQTAFIASFFALLMILHVFAWFLMGVVMAPTYILLGLGSICLLANFGAVFSNELFTNRYS